MSTYLRDLEDKIRWMMVRQLADARLVMTDRTALGKEQAALVHEALIQHWTRLQEWLEENLAFRQWQHHRLWPLLRQWEATEQDPGAQLRGVLLAEAEQFVCSQHPDLSQHDHLSLMPASPNETDARPKLKTDRVRRSS